jgi:hypothetical protein
MAELNFGLLTPPGSQNIGNAFVQGMDQAAVARARENQNALSQYTLGKARREDELSNQLLGDLRNATTPEDIYRAYQRVGKPDVALKMQTDALTQEELRNKIRAQPGLMARTAAQTDAANAARARDRQQWEGQALRNLGNNPSDDNIRALGQDAVIKEIYTQEEADQKVAEFLAIPLADRAANFSQRGAPAVVPRQPNLATDLVIPGRDGTLVPNQPLIDVKTNLARAGASSNITKVNTYLPASEEAQRDFIRSTRLTYDALKQSPAMFANMEAAKKLIPSAREFMGAGGEGMKTAASFLNSRLGMSINTEGVKDASELQARLFQGVLDNLKKLDAQPSERQQAALQAALGSISTDPNALSNVLDAYADTVRTKIDVHNAEVQSAIARGVKFPYDPIIKAPAKATKPDVYVRDANGVIRKQ